MCEKSEKQKGFIFSRDSLLTYDQFSQNIFNRKFAYHHYQIPLQKLQLQILVHFLMKLQLVHQCLYSSFEFSDSDIDCWVNKGGHLYFCREISCRREVSKSGWTQKLGLYLFPYLRQSQSQVLYLQRLETYHVHARNSNSSSTKFHQQRIKYFQNEFKQLTCIFFCICPFLCKCFYFECSTYGSSFFRLAFGCFFDAYMYILTKVQIPPVCICLSSSVFAFSYSTLW